MKTLNWVLRFKPVIDTIPNNTTGVYIVASQEKIHDEYCVVYVGQSIDVKKRLQQHCSKNEENKLLKKIIANSHSIMFFYAEADQSELDGLEKYLYYHYSSICNNDIPPGDDMIKCNLPKGI